MPIRNVLRPSLNELCRGALDVNSMSELLVFGPKCDTLLSDARPPIQGQECHPRPASPRPRCQSSSATQFQSHVGHSKEPASQVIRPLPWLLGKAYPRWSDALISSGVQERAILPAALRSERKGFRLPCG